MFNRPSVGGDGTLRKETHEQAGNAAYHVPLDNPIHVEGSEISLAEKIRKFLFGPRFENSYDHGSLFL